MTGQFAVIEGVGHNSFQAFGSGFINVIFDQVLTSDNITYLLYGFLVLMVIIFVVRFIFQSRD